MGCPRGFYGFSTATDFFTGRLRVKTRFSTLWPVPVLKLTATWLANLTSANLWSHKSSGTGWPSKIRDPEIDMPAEVFVIFHLTCISTSLPMRSWRSLVNNFIVAPISLLAGYILNFNLQPICNIGYKPANLLVILVLSHLTFTQIRFDLALT